MEILSALGVNGTIGIQLVVFLFVYIVFVQLVFGPYYKAFLERQSRTVGNTDEAERLLSKTQKLEAEYQTKAREIAQDIRAVYERTKSEALSAQEKIISSAREQAKIVTEQTRRTLQTEIQAMQSDLRREAPAVSQAITSKLLGQDVST